MNTANGGKGNLKSLTCFWEWLWADNSSVMVSKQENGVNASQSDAVSHHTGTVYCDLAFNQDLCINIL